MSLTADSLDPASSGALPKLLCKYQHSQSHYLLCIDNLPAPRVKKMGLLCCYLDTDHCIVGWGQDSPWRRCRGGGEHTSRYCVRRFWQLMLSAACCCSTFFLVLIFPQVCFNYFLSSLLLSMNIHYTYLIFF